MTNPFRPADRSPDSQASDLGFLEEARESFTQAFAYDHYQWPAFEIFGTARPSVLEFRTPALRAAEERGLALEDHDGLEHHDGGDAVQLYTTTNSDIPIYKTGVVVPVDDNGGTVTPQSAQSGPLIDLDEFRADARFDGIDGSGYAVVVIDSGIDLDDPFFGPDANNNGIADRIVYQYDFADNDGNASDVDGHGSNVASIAASSDGTYTGMAPGADIIALKVFSDSGNGFFSDIEESLQWVIANAAAYNIVSVNMSLGDGENYNAPIGLYGIADELATLASMNVIVVSASGNAFYELNSVQGVAYPSADPNSLSVGAVYDGNTGGWEYVDGAIAYTTGADHITPFSQRDDQLSDIFAPGAAITGAGAGQGLVTIHGTSQAAPHITGIVALAQQLAVEVLGRKLTYDEFSDLLAASADIIIDGDDEDDNVANTGLAFPRVNMAKLGEAILEMAEPNSFSITALSAVKAEGNSGSTAFTFTVTRSGYSGEAASVDYAVSGGAVNGADFAGNLLPAGTVSFAAGQTSKTLTILVKGDTISEGNEAFTVSLSNASGGGSIATGSAGGVIVNDDAAPPSSFFAIAAADAVRLEGDAGTTAFTFTVTRGGDTGQAASVGYSVGGGTVDGADFAGGALPGGTLSFAAGETSKTLTVLVQGDAAVEADEGFTVTLANPSANASITGATAAGVIANDDSEPGSGVVLLQADFDATNDTEGFGYRDGLFGGSTFQRYASGDWEDQALRVLLGGVNNNMARNISGGWQADFSLSEETEVELSFLYNLSIGADYELDEYTRVLVSIDGGAPFLVEQLTGDGNGGPQQTTGLQSISLALGSLAAGSHSIEIGGFNNQKTWSNEVSELLIDDVMLTAASAPPPPDPSSFAIAALDAVKAEGDAGGTAFTFTVTRGGDTSTAAAVDYAVSGATNGADFAGGALPAGTLTFLTGETSKTLTVTVAGDTDFEPDESFTVTLSNASEGGAITTASAGGTIVNDDVVLPAAILDIASLDSSKAEGDAGSTDFTFVVTRSGNTATAVTVGYQVSSQGATAADFVGSVLPSGTLAFAAGETTKVITVPVAGDTAFENNEGFAVYLQNPSPGAAIGTAIANGSIINDDAAPAATMVAISTFDSINAEGNGVNTEALFRLNRSGDISQEGWVDYTVSGISSDAASADDFVGGVFPSGRIEFAAGQDLKYITLQIAGDFDIEADEDFQVTLTDASPGTAITTAAAEGTINNDDEVRGPTYFFASAYDAEKAEGDSGTTAFTFLVTRSGDTDAIDVINFTVSGSGPNPADTADFYSGYGGNLPSGIIVFHEGETSETVTILVAGDSDVEAEEHFTFTISGGHPNAQIQKPSDEATIENDDFPAGGPFVLIDADFNGSFSGTEDFSYVRGVFGGPTDPSLTRGNWTSADITVVLGGGGSTQGTMTGGWERSFTLDQEMELSLSFLYDIFHSRHFEADEYTLVLVSVDGGAPILIDQIAGSAGSTADYIIDPTTAQVDLGTFGPGTHSIVIGGLLNKMDGPEEYNTIGIDDVLLVGAIPDAPVTSFAIAALDAVKPEGDAATTAFTFTVSRSGDTSTAGSVDYAVTGAANGADFAGGVLPGGTVSFAAGETSKTLTLQVAGDMALEADEGFTVTLSNASAGSEIATASANGTILNDDAPPVYDIAALDAVKAEGDSGDTLFTFTISRSGDLTFPGNISYSLSGHGANPAAGTDFASGLFVLNTATFAEGQSSVTITIRVAGDINFEADEGFIVAIFDPTHGGTVGTASATGTVLNDDPLPITGSFSIAADDAVVAEGDSGVTALTFTVSRSGDGSGPATVDYALTSGGASGSDFAGGVLPAGTLSFAAGELTKTLTLQVQGDTAVEPDESFIITLSNPSAGSDISVPTAVGTIQNDDVPPPATFLAIAALDAVQAEGDAGSTAFTFTVTRTGDTSAADSVDYAVTGSANGADFAGGVLPGGTVSFAAGETSKTLTLQVAGDTAFEADEGFTVTLSNASAGSEITTASAAGTIVNDDAAPPAIFYEIVALSADKLEGNSGSGSFTSFMVTRSGATENPSTVHYSLTGSGANPADDEDFVFGLFNDGVIDFGIGETSRVINIVVQGDTLFEADEGFTVTLHSPSAGSAITTASAAGTIVNDDPAPPATFLAIAALDAVQAEGDIGETFLTFTVTRSGDTTAAGSVDYAVTGDVDGADFVGGLLPAGTLAFAAGEVSKTLSFNVAGDGDEEPDETLTVTLSNASAGAAITTASAGGTILNDDAPPPPIESFLSISAADAVRSEGDDGSTLFTFIVSRPGTVIGEASVDWTVTGTGSNPADASDFVGGILPGGTVTIQGDGASGATIVIAVSGDSDIEADEDFTVTLSNPSAGAAIVTASAAGTILNDDVETPPPEGIVILAADFDAPGDTEGFVYRDGVFTPLSFQIYASGSWEDQALTIDLGGRDTRIATNIAGAWETDFVLAGEMEVTLSFAYEMIISSSYEREEYSQLLVSIDGGSPILIEELRGGGVLSDADSVVLDLGSLGAGSHSIAIGGYNNRKSWSDEATEITIDDLLVTGTPAAGGAAAGHLPAGPEGGGLQAILGAGYQENEVTAYSGF